MREFKISKTITQRTPTLIKYFQDVQNEKLLTSEEEVED